ncbi:hypothetical protein P8452_09375 [Trifolium repens]|nr:hypothetical protein P8452_09375 [Trifolium repens]
MTHGAELRLAGRNQGSERGRRRDSTEEKKYDSSYLMVQSNPFLYAEILKKMNTQIYDGRRERERDGAAERWPPEERDGRRRKKEKMNRIRFVSRTRARKRTTFWEWTKEEKELLEEALLEEEDDWG